ncbi:MAG: sulfurtransferase [Planctomycetota bacterium]|nr:MAG: sulfurtransferase [Planctomycetota bacterium]
MFRRIEELDPADAARRLRESEDIVLLDCREPEELAIARIEGAVHIPMGDIPLRMTELDPDRQIIVFCHRGKRSYSVASYLRKMDFEKVYNLRGGIDAWSREVDPTVPRY